jgi:CdiI immunity protein
MAENPMATVQQATRELEDFLKLNLSEQELADMLFDDLGANVHAPGMGLTYRQWLEAVLAILKSGPKA